MIADTDCNSGCAAGNHIAAHEGNVCVIGYAVFGRADIRRFFNGLAFSSQTCLTDKQIFCIQNADIGGNHIPGGQMHNIAHHQIVHRNFSFFLLPAGNRTGGRDHGQ